MSNIIFKFALIITGVVCGANLSACDQTDSPFDTAIYYLNKILFFFENSNNGAETSRQMDFKLFSHIPGLDEAPTNCRPAPSMCPESKYRPIDGSCNNLQHPGWGTPFSIYGRLLKSKYGNGIDSLPKAVSGGSLPNVRYLSYTLFPDKQIYDPRLSLLAMQWGQVVAHDMSLTQGITQINNTEVVCCKNGVLGPDALDAAQCAPIIIPADDPVYKPGSCMNFDRTVTTEDVGCGQANSPAQQISAVTAYMDLSIVYGNTKSEAQKLRASSGGLMKSIEKGGKEWPPQSANVTGTCVGAKSPREACYATGDVRANQSPELAMLQVIMFREHNRVARALSSINPHWNSERVYQEARRIVIAEYQYINYYEYLPVLLGFDNMMKYKLIYSDDIGYTYDYNPQVNAAALNEHSNGAYRFPHTMIRGQLELVKEDRVATKKVRLSSYFNRPQILEEGDNFDGFVRGCAHQKSSKVDRYFDSEVTKYLFRGSKKLGADLRAVDIQRGRDHGLGSYVSARTVCGLSVPKKFSDLHGIISDDNIKLLRAAYRNIKDVDLVVGGALEKLYPGSVFGPTFQCIIINQFYRTRVGDRFFFENGASEETSLSLWQLESITHTSMARVLCDNSQVVLMQPEAFRHDGEWNRRVPCADLPSIDLTLWRENTEDSCEEEE